MNGEARPTGAEQLTFWATWNRPRVLRPDELVVVFEADDPRVVRGDYNVFGFTPNEWRAYHKKLEREGIPLCHGSA